MSALSERLINSLIQWHGEQFSHPLGPANVPLFDRVTEVIIADQEKTLNNGPGTPDNILIALVNETRGVGSSVRPPAPPAEDARHSSDFRSVHWYGTDYEFTTMQANCIRVMWEAWNRGTAGLAQVTILEAAGSAGERLRDVFEKGKHPAWGRMVVDGNTKGSYLLAEPK